VRPLTPNENLTKSLKARSLALLPSNYHIPFFKKRDGTEEGRDLLGYWSRRMRYKSR
jgi:hypothetical protein